MEINVTTNNMLFLEALSSETRVKIIEMLNQQSMNIKEISSKLGISSAIVTKHIQKLEDAGIISSTNMSGKRGMQKVCSLSLDRAVLQFKSNQTVENFHAHSIPVGYYTSFEVKPTCGLSSVSKPIGMWDDPRYFAEPEHVNASLIWFGSGWVEYKIPNYLSARQKIKSIEISLELCSEAPGYNESWPSDITFYLNNIEIGMWTCPGDFGGKKGVLTPEWWHASNNTEYGLLKTITVNEEASFIDGVKLSNVNINSLDIGYGKEIPFRVACLDTAVHQGGVTLFGSGFGNYKQDINIIIKY